MNRKGVIYLHCIHSYIFLVPSCFYWDLSFTSRTALDDLAHLDAGQALKEAQSIRYKEFVSLQSGRRYILPRCRLIESRTHLSLLPLAFQWFKMIWSFVVFVLMSAVNAGCTTNWPLGTIEIPWTLNQLKLRVFLQLERWQTQAAWFEKVHRTHCTSLNSNKCNIRRIWSLINPTCLLELAELPPGSALINMEGLHASVVRAVWVSLPPRCSCLIQTFGCGWASPLPPSFPR